MTKTTQRLLILTRHAKAVEDVGAGDHARALSARGLEDAAALGEWLAQHAITPDQVFCSTATRTRQTLAVASDHFRVGESPEGTPKTTLSNNWPTILRDKMYLAGAGELLAQIQGADDAATCLMLVGHNPGMHGLLALLVHDYAHERDAERVAMKFPTAACAVLRLDAPRWNDVAPQSAMLEHLRWSVDG